ncbi:MAG: hypothetical protein V1866_07115 [archaeon]
MSGNNPSGKRKISFGQPLLVLALACAVLLLSSCSGGYRPSTTDTDYFVGSQGVNINFMSESTLDELYENSSFAINMVIENNGAHDIAGDEQGILTISYDPFYISASQPEANNDNKNIELLASGIIVKGLQLYGKSKYYPMGSDIFLSFSNFKAKAISGQRSKPSTQLFISFCYPYVTTLSRLVCVDFNTYGQNLRDQVCSQKDLSLSDQGAPIAIRKVEVENQPVQGDLVRPAFIIQIYNVGGGSVLSPGSSADIESVCASKQLSREDLNAVDVEAFLSQNIKLSCSPSKVRLVEGEGYTRCTVADEDMDKLLAYHQNYEAPLTINLTYIYLSTLSKDVEIKRLNIYGGSITPENECQPYEVNDGSGCITKCEYCAQHPTESQCNPANAKYGVEFKPGFACKCSAKNCNDIYPDGLCLPFSNFCPGLSFCCATECKAPKMMVDGKCYPKCSQCTEVQTECVCGTDANYIAAPLAKGTLCCPKLPQVYANGKDPAEKKMCSDECAAASAAN